MGRGRSSWGKSAFALWLVGTLSAGAGYPAESAPAPPTENRTWSDASGRFKVEASFVDYKDGKVLLRKASDGTTIEVRLDQLSQADQRWLRSEVARRRPRRGETEAADANRGAADEWPGWRGPNRDGRSPDQGLLREWPPEGPAKLWQVDGIGTGYSSVAVSGGTVYITGDRDGRLILSAFDLEGKPRWEVDVDAAWTGDHPGSRATPTLDGGSVYLVSGNGQVGCYDARNGKTKWAAHMREFGGEVPNWGYSESVLVQRNLAVITPGGERCIVALDKSSGKPVWASAGFRAGAQYSSNYAFACAGQTIVTNGTAAGIVGLDLKSGRTLWTNPFSAQNTANCPTPVYADGYVFWANGYGKGGICLKLDAERGGVRVQEAWRTRDMVCHHGGYIIDQGHIYGNNNNAWVCLDLKTGRKLYEERGIGKGSVCYADGMLYLFGEDGGQVGLATCSPSGLEMKGQFRVEGEGPSWAHPVVIGGRLYLRYDSHLYCFNVAKPPGT